MNNFFARQPLNDGFTWMTAEQIGAPQMNAAQGSEGQFLQVLDAALITGFGEKTASGVKVEGDNATISFGTSSGFLVRQLVEISGASDAKLNGRQRVIAVVGNDIVVKVPGLGAVTGTIKVKVAPLGWESLFGTTNPLKRAYRSKNPQNFNPVLFLNMELPPNHGYNSANPAKRCSISVCEDMKEIGVQINSFTDGYNNFNVNTNGALFWYQGRYSSKDYGVNNAVNSSWVIVGNGDYFYIFHEWQTYYSRGGKYRDTYGFGNFIPINQNDRFNTMLMCSRSANDNAYDFYYANNGCRVNHSDFGLVIRDFNGLGGVQGFYPASDINANGDRSQYSSGGEQSTSIFPNPENQAMLTLPLYVRQRNNGHHIRGMLPRLLAIPHNLTDQMGFDLSVNNNILMVACQYYPSSSNYRGFWAIDLGD